MDSIEVALEYAKKKKINRLNRDKIRRSKARSKFRLSSYKRNSADIEQSVVKDFISMNLSPLDTNQSTEAAMVSCSTPVSDSDEHLIEEDDELLSSDISDDLGLNVRSQQQKTNHVHLHEYTSTSCLSFSQDLIGFIRNANISKSHAENLIRLIKSSLPQPNTLPDNYTSLLNLLSVEDLFMKRTVCIICKNELSTTSKFCLQCTNIKPQRLANVFDAMQEIMFTRVYNRLSSIIKSYREIFTQQLFDDENNDIVYNRNYRTLFSSIDYPFISIILHLDGINLSESNKQPMWVLSCSIVELPPAVRNCRQNNVILSIWVSKEQPDIKLWLDKTINQLIHLKSTGFPTRFDDRMMLKVYGVIGDCPALGMALNHIQHGGYYCCWFCKIEGEHIDNKRQYYYKKNPSLRDTFNFSSDSRQAQHLQKNINGRLGISIFEKLVDIPLPKSVIADYLHITLLRHGKTILLYLYKKIMKPAERMELDKTMAIQSFPHFFTRKIRLLKESFLKATEIRNFLLYCAIPMFRNILDVYRLAHLSLFILGIRLLHGRRMLGNETADQAHVLLTTFYRDHEIYYVHKQNFTLHVHAHYAELYRDHGSLCNINTFSQEDIMGAISKYKHGSRFWGDQICFYLNIDFALKNVDQNEGFSSSVEKSEGVFDVIFSIPVELIEVMPNIHKRFCNCDNPNYTCIKFYRRFKNKKKSFIIL